MVVSLQLGQDEPGWSNFEQDPTGIRCGIKIRNLTKEYKVCMYMCVCVCVCVCVCACVRACVRAWCV